MEARKQSWKEKANRDNIDEVEDDSEEEDQGGGGESSFGVDERKKKPTSLPARRGGGGAVSPPLCQAERCGANLTEAKRYHRRHKVCEFHSKAPAAIVAGLPQRFCQQCSRFHELSEFDEAKRSCRRRLAGHNERRRKSSAECYGEVSNRKASKERESQITQTDDQRGRIQLTPPQPQGNSTTYKHFYIR